MAREASWDRMQTDWIYIGLWERRDLVPTIVQLKVSTSGLTVSQGGMRNSKIWASPRNYANIQGCRGDAVIWFVIERVQTFQAWLTEGEAREPLYSSCKVRLRHVVTSPTRDRRGNKKKGKENLCGVMRGDSVSVPHSKVGGADNIIAALERLSSGSTMFSCVLSTSGDFQVPNWRTSLP